MAVDTLPNALAIDTSSYFGEALSKYVMEPILKGYLDNDSVIERATILKNGELTERFSYLKDFAEKDMETKVSIIGRVVERDDKWIRLY